MTNNYRFVAWISIYIALFVIVEYAFEIIGINRLYSEVNIELLSYIIIIFFVVFGLYQASMKFAKALFPDEEASP